MASTGGALPLSHAMTKSDEKPARNIIARVIISQYSQKIGCRTKSLPTTFSVLAKILGTDSIIAK